MLLVSLTSRISAVGSESGDSAINNTVTTADDLWEYDLYDKAEEIAEQFEFLNAAPKKLKQHAKSHSRSTPSPTEMGVHIMRKKGNKE